MIRWALTERPNVQARSWRNRATSSLLSRSARRMDRLKREEKEDMARVTRAASHVSLDEVKKRMRTDPRAMSRHGFLIIYNALVEPRAASEIARHCGVSKATVHAVISRDTRLGVAAIEMKGQGGRRQYLTL